MRNFIYLILLFLAIGVITTLSFYQNSFLRKRVGEDFGCVKVQQYQKYGIYVKNICDQKYILQFTLQDVREKVFSYRSECLGPQQSSYFSPKIDGEDICNTDVCQVLNTSTIPCSYLQSDKY